MRASLFLGIVLLATGVSFAAEARGRGSAAATIMVRGYYTARGTYVAPYRRTAPDGVLSNNLSYRGSAVLVEQMAVSTSLAPVEAQASRPWCDDGKVAGSGAGFCVVN